MSYDKSTRQRESESSTGDFWRHKGFEKSLLMTKSDANKILNGAKDGQKIDPVTITAALWVTGDVDSA